MNYLNKLLGVIKNSSQNLKKVKNTQGLEILTSAFNKLITLLKRICIRGTECKFYKGWPILFEKKEKN